MNEKRIVREAMKSIGWSMQQLAEAMSFKTVSGISNRLNSGSSAMRVDTFVKMLNAMGYEVEVKSKSRDNKNKWVVGEETEEDKVKAEIASLSPEAKKLLGIED